jgi:hypothetical protein
VGALQYAPAGAYRIAPVPRLFYGGPPAP